MSFPTVDCYFIGNTPVDPIPTEGWVVQIVDPFNLGNMFLCDPEKSQLYGFEPPEYQGMTQSEFYTLWPLILGVLVTGAIFKYLRHQMIHY